MGESAVESTRTPGYDLLLGMVREERERAGQSQYGLSRALGKSRTYVAKVESGTRRLDLVELFELLGALGADPVAFVREYASRLKARG